MAERKKDSDQASEKQRCLVIMPFSDPNGYESGHFRKIYDHILVPAIAMAGYLPHRIDENTESTMIHGKLLDELINAPMVLCDLSSKNPNVLYELGIRHAFDKPVVLVQEKGQDRIFDIAGLTTVEYRKARLYDEVLDDQKAIAESIRQTATAKKYSIMSLVHLDPAKVNTSEHITQEDRMMFAISELNRQMNRMEEQIAKIQPQTSAFRRGDSVDSMWVNVPEKARMEIVRQTEEAYIALRESSRGDRKLKEDYLLMLHEKVSTAIRNYRPYVRPEDTKLRRAIEVQTEIEALINKLITGE